MKSAALVLLIVVGMVFTVLGQDDLTPEQIIKAVMGKPPPYWKVMFALDSSGSISDKEWLASKSSCGDLIEIISKTPGPNSIGPTKHRLGLVRFSDTDVDVTKVFHKLGTIINRDALDLVPKEGIFTYTKRALELCDGELGAAGKRLVVIYTDGKHTVGEPDKPDKGDPVKKAEAMKKKGIIICVVAVGNNPNMKQINEMASSILIDGKLRKCVLKKGAKP